ncbi:MAG: acetyl esterase/lipase [Verrucomicrobiales bacterium]|jgi:acetyl esterase/lipase
MKTLSLFFALAANASCAEPIVVDLWPGVPPGPARELSAEADLTKPDDKLIAGRRIIKLGNVSTPQIAVYRPPADKDTGAAVVICPGGGHHILAYDLEGTEVAEWLNSIGITGVILKYRVPRRDANKRWEMAVQDGQRAMSVVRSKAEAWGIDPKRIGILGFSAGGETAGRVSLFGDSSCQYEVVDGVDKFSRRPDFSIFVYAAGFVGKDKQLHADIKITKDTPPAFFVTTFDDFVDPLNSLLYAAELKKVGVQAGLHLFAKGGHGYGLRHVDGLAVTDWPKLCADWLEAIGVLPNS